MKKEMFCAILCVVLALFLNFSGIKWGTPDSSRIDLVFGSRTILEASSKAMSKSRAEVRDSLDQIYNHHEYEDWDVGISDSKNKIFVKRSIIDSARTYLLRSYGPDEQRPIVALSGMKPSKMDFNPKFFSYGGFFIYSLGGFLKILSLFKMVVLNSDASYYFFHPEEMGKFFIFARVLGAIFSALSIFVIFLIGKELYGKRTGVLSAFFLCITPGIVFWSHFCKPFAFCLFWTLLSFYYSVKILRSKKLSNYVLASIFAGLAAGAVVIHGIIFLSLLFAHFIGIYNENKSLKQALLSLFSKKILLCLVVFIGFIILVNPYYVIEFASAKAELSETGRWWSITPTFANLWHYITTVLSYQFGFFLWLSAIAGFCFFVYRRKKEDLLILFLVLPFLFYLSSAAENFTHHGLSLLPFLIIPIANFFDNLFENKKIKIPVLVIIIFVASLTFLNSLALDRIFYSKNTRDIAAEWIKANIKEKSSIGIFESPSPYWAPPLNPFKYNLVVTREDRITKILDVEKPDYFIVSDIEFQSRVKGINSYREEKIRMLGMLDGYVLERLVEKKCEIFGIKFSWFDQEPFDWSYARPTIFIFKKIHKTE